MNQHLQIVEEDLKHIVAYLPIAIAVGRLEDWAKIYTAGYMLKLRVMR